MAADGFSRLELDSQGTITQAPASVEAVLGRAPASLVGRGLGEVLGLAAEETRALLVGAREAPPGLAFAWRDAPGSARVCIRVEVRFAHGSANASLLDLSHALEGAPPLQLAGLASALSHELRNPLSSVKMAVQTLARNAGLSDRDQRRLSIANREIRTVERMLWLLSEYGRLGSTNLEPHAPSALIDAAVALVAPELSERGVEVSLDAPSPGPLVLADSGRTRAVLGQLLLGIAMGNPGRTRIDVVATVEGSDLVLCLDDPATRPTPEELARAFEPFASPLSRGAGLSLAALAAVMQQQGGAASIRDHGEGGLSFLLRFRIAR